MMRLGSKSGRIISAFCAVVFLMTSLFTFGVFADVTIGSASTKTVPVGGTATINVADAVGSEQTTVLVYLGTPDDENIIYIDQKAATDGSASFTFKVPAVATPGTYTVLAGSESSAAAGQGTLVVTDGGETPVKTLESIAVSDAKTAYTVGDEFAAPTVTATYSDGTTKDVTADATVTGYDMAAEGTQTVTVTYEGKTATYEITVTSAGSGEETNWSITNTFDPDINGSGAYNNRWADNGSGDSVNGKPVSGVGLGGSSAFSVSMKKSGWGGVQTIRNFSADWDWSKAKYISFVGRANNPAATTDRSNKISLSFGGVTVKPEAAGDNWQYYSFPLTDSTGNFVDLSAVNEIQVSPGKSGSTGFVIDNLTISNYEIAAPALPAVKTIEVTGAATAYEVGAEFDTATGSMVVTYDDDTTLTMPLAAALIEGFDSSAPAASRTVTVSFAGATTQITVSIAEGEPIPEIPADPTIPEAPEGSWSIVNTFNPDIFPGNAYDGRWAGDAGSTTKKIAFATDGIGASNAIGMDYNRTGNWGGVQTIKNFPAEWDWSKAEYLSFYTRLYYEKNALKDVSLQVNVGGASKKYTLNNYDWNLVVIPLTDSSGAPIDKTAITQIQFTINTKGACKQVIDNMMLSNYDPENPSSFVPDIPGEVVLESIAVNEDVKKDYTVGDEFAAPTVTATYSDGTTKDVTAEATVAGYDMAAEGKQTVTVTYEGKTATYEITVTAPVVEVVLESIAVNEDVKKDYTVGDEFAAPTVTATYSDGTTKDVTAEATVAGYDMATAGKQTVTVTYEGKTVTYEITVVPAAPKYTAEVRTTEILDEEAGVVYITKFVLDQGNGTLIVKIGDVQLAWSEERQCYVGFINADNYVASAGTISNISVTEASEALPSIKYGDNSADGKINNSDLAFYKNYLELGQPLTVKLSADVNIDGRLDNTDLSILKDYLELDKAIISAE